MKKLISMLALCSMLFGLGACSSDDNDIDNNGKQKGCVYVRLENVVSPGSRMTEDPKTDKDVTELRNGFIVFGTPKAAIRKHYEIVSDPAMLDKSDHVVLLDELRNGKTFEGIPGDVTNVSIIANVTDEELSPDEFHNGTIRSFNEILAKKIHLRNQYADNMSHVALYDMQELKGEPGGNMSATLELKPMCARLEIPKIIPGPDIVEYKVDGIYLAGFYKQSRIEQTCVREDWVYPDYDADDADGALTDFYKGYSYMINTDIKAVQETVGEGDAAKEITAYYPEAEGKVWAYPFFGMYERRGETEHYGLRLIVKVSGLKVYMVNTHGDRELRDVKQYDLDHNIPAERAGIRYLNINGFVDEYHNTQAKPIKFYNGNVYQVQNFEITTQNLSDKIMPTDIDVTLTVSVKPWTIKKVYPQI